MAGTAQASLFWSAVPSATSYEVFRSVNGTPFLLDQVGVAGTTAMDTGLTNGVAYAYYVCAVTTDGTGTASNTVTLTPGSILLPAPMGLAASPYSSANIQLTWNPVPGASSYHVYRGDTSGGEDVTPIATGVGSPTYVDSDQSLVVGNTYFYEVTAVDSVGESGKSNEASAAPGLPLLAAPILVATPSSGQAALSWTTISGASGYNLYRASAGNAAQFLAFVSTGTVYTDTGLTNGVTYSYYVCAVRAVGQGNASNTVTVTPGSSAPSVPGGLTATANGISSITLNWNAVVGASSYNIYRATAAGMEGAVAFKTGVTGSSYNDSSVSAGTTYYYIITSLNTNGQSGRSNEASAKPGVRPLGAAVLTASPTSTQINLAWSAVTGAASYNLYRSIGTSSSFTLYQRGLTATTYTDTAVQNGVPYYYYVAAVATAGLGSASNTATATPGGAVPGSAVLYAVAGESQVSLYWISVDGATSYTLYRSTT